MNSDILVRLQEFGCTNPQELREFTRKALECLRLQAKHQMDVVGWSLRLEKDAGGPEMIEQWLNDNPALYMEDVERFEKDENEISQKLRELGFLNIEQLNQAGSTILKLTMDCAMYGDIQAHEEVQPDFLH